MVSIYVKEAVEVVDKDAIVVGNKVHSFVVNCIWSIMDMDFEENYDNFRQDFVDDGVFTKVVNYVPSKVIYVEIRKVIN